jgi:hypothetical protein
MTHLRILCVFATSAIFLAAFHVEGQTADTKKDPPKKDAHKPDPHAKKDANKPDAHAKKDAHKPDTHAKKDEHKPDAHAKKDEHKPVHPMGQQKTDPVKTAAQAKSPPKKDAPWPVAYIHLHHALWELREARHELERARIDFGGLKERAHHAINHAAGQLDLILEYKNSNTRGIPTRRDLTEVYKRYPNHPHLRHAVHELRNAHNQLRADPYHYNGHKEDALRAIHHAAGEIELLLQKATGK